jgi:hypothetical protein
MKSCPLSAHPLTDVPPQSNYSQPGSVLRSDRAGHWSGRHIHSRRPHLEDASISVPRTHHLLLGIVNHEKWDGTNMQHSYESTEKHAIAEISFVRLVYDVKPYRNNVWGYQLDSSGSSHCACEHGHEFLWFYEWYGGSVRAQELLASQKALSHPRS